MLTSHNSYDTHNKILTRPISSRSPSEEPNAKRKKSDAPVDTISNRAASGIYSSLEHVIIDIKDACQSLLEKLPPVETDSSTANAQSAESNITRLRIAQFKKKAEEILEVERRRETSRRTGQVASTPPSTGSKANVHLVAKPGAGRAVLTVWGNAPQAKQLFSGLQEAVKDETGSEIYKPLPATGLPSAVSTTEIYPFDSVAVNSEKQSKDKLGQMFASTSIKMPPPKISRSVAGKGEVVGWVQPSTIESSRSKNSQSYHAQKMICGQWLDYSGAKSKSDTEDSKLDALFKNAYSSFAPARDDTAAIISTSTRNRLWWAKHGESAFAELIGINEKSEDNKVALPPTPETSVLDGFKIEDVSDSMIDPALQDEPVRSIEEQDAEEVLQSISELLETLSSFQRNRYLSAPSTHFGDTALPKPTDAEIATYDMLKSQLAVMIATLPPYFVSKIDADQLADLNVSTKLEVYLETHKGTMEEDEETRRAKAAELARRPAPSPSVHRNSSSFGSQYSSSGRPPTNPQAYYSQTPVRPPPTSQRPPATAPQPYVPKPQAVPQGYRPPQPTYPSTPTYPHQLPRAQHAPYTGGQYYQSQTPTYNHPQGYSAPMTAPQNRYPQAGIPQYQQPRQPPPPNGMAYGYTNGSPAPRQPSPQKYNSPQPPPVQPNRSYGSPAPPMTNGRYYAPLQNGTNSAPGAGAQHQGQGQVGASGFHTVMSAAEQSSMLDRQRAQLAQQQGGYQPQSGGLSQNGGVNGSGVSNGVTAGQ